MGRAGEGMKRKAREGECAYIFFWLVGSHSEYGCSGRERRQMVLKWGEVDHRGGCRGGTKEGGGVSRKRDGRSIKEDESGPTSFFYTLYTLHGTVMILVHVAVCFVVLRRVVK